jgi:cell division transport system permease protein
LSGQLTVELPGIAGEDDAQRQQRVDAALEEITDTNGIVGTRLLDEAEVKRLLQPWLGDQADQLGVTLPDLVAVSVQPDIRPNLSELAERLQQVSPGAAIDDHAQFNAGALRFLRTIEVLALSLLGLVLVATAGVVAFVARAGLSIHRRIVEIVHLVGAHDSYVARQFQAQAFRYGFMGACLGSLLAAATLLSAGVFAARGAAPMSAAVKAFEPWMIWPLALIPLAAVLIAMVTVRIAVLQALRRMAY